MSAKKTERFEVTPMVALQALTNLPITPESGAIELRYLVAPTSQTRRTANLQDYADAKVSAGMCAIYTLEGDEVTLSVKPLKTNLVYKQEAASLVREIANGYRAVSTAVRFGLDKRIERKGQAFIRDTYIPEFIGQGYQLWEAHFVANMVPNPEQRNYQPDTTIHFNNTGTYSNGVDVVIRLGTGLTTDQETALERWISKTRTVAA